MSAAEENAADGLFIKNITGEIRSLSYEKNIADNIRSGFCVRLRRMRPVFRNRRRRKIGRRNSLQKRRDAFRNRKNTRPEYAKWRRGQLEELSKNVEFGPWYISHAYNYRHADKFDPFVYKFDKDAYFENETFWKTPEFPDGQPLDIQQFNPLYLSNTYTFAYRKIYAKRDCKITVTLWNFFAMQIGLNGKLLATVTKDGKIDETFFKNPKAPWKSDSYPYRGWTGWGKTFVLDLKKGENEFYFKIKNNLSKGEKSIMFSPFADPSAELAEMAKKDFPFETKTLQAWKNSKSAQTVPALFSAADNSEFMREALENLVETSMFSAGALEEKVNAVKDGKDEKSFIERIKIFEEGINDRFVDRTLGYDIKNVRAAMEDMAKSYPEYDKKLFGELKKWEGEWKSLRAGVLARDKAAIGKAEEFKAFAKRARRGFPQIGRAILRLQTAIKKTRTAITSASSLRTRTKTNFGALTFKIRPRLRKLFSSPPKTRPFQI